VPSFEEDRDEREEEHLTNDAFYRFLREYQNEIAHKIEECKHRGTDARYYKGQRDAIVNARHAYQEYRKK
jgi:UDP-2,3-diacylglucosamine pyrophosphatase LpxH